MMEGLDAPDHRYAGAFRGEPGLERIQVRVGAFIADQAIMSDLAICHESRILTWDNGVSQDSFRVRIASSFSQPQYADILKGIVCLPMSLEPRAISRMAQSNRVRETAYT
jgi:hypothetical protein